MTITRTTIITAFLLSAAIGAFASHRLATLRPPRAADTWHEHPTRLPAKDSPAAPIRDLRIRHA
jgi:hypothetical protein